MDLGSNVVDFLSIIQLANKLRKEIAAAPAQYKAISEEVRSLSIVLQDADILTERSLSPAQATELSQVTASCTHLLEELQTTLERYKVLERRPTDLSGKLKKAWKRVAWEPEDIRDLRGRITSNITLLEALNGHIIRDNTFKLIQNYDDEERKAILNWLTAAEYATQHSDFIERREPGTGEWFLESKEYRQWITCAEPTLFSPGIPGSGKTILASIVIDDVLHRYQQDPDVGIAYIYLNFRQQEQQRLQNLLSSLLKQLLYKKPTLPESIRELHDAHVAKGTRPSISELSAALSRVAASYTSIYLVIDALDECRVADGCRQEFINQLLSLQLQTGVTSQLFATSRSIPEIAEHFEDSLILRVRATDEDVSRYVDSSLARLSRCVRDDKDLQAEIKREIVKCVDGMFLLAQLHLDSLKGKKSRKAIRIALQNLPTGSEAYHYAYDEAMARIEGQLQDEKELAIEVLLWISSAVRPLRIAELEHALAIESGESALDQDNLCPVEELVSVCAGLVTVDQGTGIVRLVHFTTQQYFERTRDKWFPGADLKISASCVAYLLFDEFESGPCIAPGAFYARLQNHPFYDYAATSWGPHAKRCGVEGVRVTDQLDIFKHPEHVDSMSQALMATMYWPLHVDFDTQFAKGMTGLHLAAFFGFREMAEHYLNQGMAPDLADSHARTPLCWAAMKGDLEIVKLLVNTGKVDPLKEDNNTRTPLSWAAQGGFLDIVKLFLESDYNLDPDEVDSYGWTPLCWAAEYGRVEVVKLFLSLPNVNPSSRDKENRTPLSWAAKNGHLEVVRLLVEATGGADVDLPDENGWTPVAWASDEGADDVIRFLVEVTGASPASRDMTGRTPLTWAAQYGHDSTARLLMGLPGVEVSSRQDDGRTPLFWAVLYGHANVVRCLLEAAPNDGDLKDESGRTAFSWAAMYGQVAIMQLLLDIGKIDPDSRDHDNRGPISWAAGGGQAEAVEMLLDRSDVDPAAPDTSNRTPLGWALCYSRNSDVLELLLESHVSSINLQDDSGRSMLAHAVQSSYTEAVEVLMRAEGVDINIADHNGRTPLSLAAEHGYTTVIQALLLSPDIDLNKRDLDGKSPLHYSIMARGHATPRLLLQAASIDPDPRDNDGRTPLSYAASDSTREVVETLSAVPGVDIGSRDKMGRTPLFWAVWTGREDAIQALLGAERLPDDIDGLCRNDPGLSVVDWAAFRGDDKLVGMLVDRGATMPEDILGVQRLFSDGEV